VSVQLWAETIELVASINQSPTGAWASRNITFYHDKVYFTADDRVIGDELYVHAPVRNEQL